MYDLSFTPIMMTFVVLIVVIMTWKMLFSRKGKEFSKNK